MKKGKEIFDSLELDCEELVPYPSIIKIRTFLDSIITSFAALIKTHVTPPRTCSGTSLKLK